MSSLSVVLQEIANIVAAPLPPARIVRLVRAKLDDIGFVAELDRVEIVISALSVEPKGVVVS